MSVKKKIEALNENLQDIMESTKSVKGPEFANLVGATFESFQLVNIIKNLFDLIQKNVDDAEHKAALAKMEEGTLELISSIVEKASLNVKDSAQFKEAIDLGRSLFERCVDTSNSIIDELSNGNQAAS